MSNLRVRNWPEFQQYRDRRPPWIKLHRSLLDDPNWYRLSGESAKYLTGLWLLASEDDQGFLPEIVDISFRLRLSDEVTRGVIDELLTAGFLEMGSRADAPERWPSRYVSKKVREAVMERDQQRCVWCESEDNLEIDHVVPISGGGTSDPDNLQVLCRPCNRRKRNLPPEEAEKRARGVTQENIVVGQLPNPETEVERETESSDSSNEESGAGPEVEDEWNSFAQWFRNEGCFLLWQGTTPPDWANQPDRPWTLGRDLSICKNFVGQGETLEDLRAVIENVKDPTTMAFFWQNGERQRWNTALGEIHKNERPALPPELRVEAKVPA